MKELIDRCAHLRTRRGAQCDFGRSGNRRHHSSAFHNAIKKAGKAKAISDEEALFSKKLSKPRA